MFRLCCSSWEQGWDSTVCASLSLSLSVSFGLSLPFLLTVIGTLVTPQLLQICVTFHDMQTYLMLSSHLWLKPFLWAVIDDCSTKRLAICPSVHPSIHLSIYLSVYCLSVLSVYALTVFLKCFGTFFETVLTFSKLWEQMSQLFAGTSELYCMSAKCSYSLKYISLLLQNLVIVSVIWPRPPKYNIFLSSCEPHCSKCLVMFSFFTITVNRGN